MSNNLSKKIILVGAGNMAFEYSKVISALNHNCTVFGRGINSAQAFREKTNLEVHLSSIRNYFTSEILIPEYAIVAVSIDQLASITKELIDIKIPKILVEKPGGLTFEEISDLNSYAATSESKVFVAYNRRFYSSVIEAKKIIECDGGVLSFNFEFTEWGHVIEKYNFSKQILDNWFLANSTHVIDLAFYLGGQPTELNSYTAGSLNWHAKASRFCGSGVTENGALFSYSANWDAPGRWVLDILTKNNRLLFKPLEKLQIQKKGSVLVEELLIDDSLDKSFKPGLFLQTENFLNDVKKLVSLNDQNKSCSIYYEILNS